MAKGTNVRSGVAATSEDNDPPRAQTIRLPTSLWRALKHRAIDEERPMSEIIRDALNAYLKESRRGSG